MPLLAREQGADDKPDRGFAKCSGDSPVAGPGVGVPPQGARPSLFDERLTLSRFVRE